MTEIATPERSQTFEGDGRLSGQSLSKVVSETNDNAAPVSTSIVPGHFLTASEAVISGELLAVPRWNRG